MTITVPKIDVRPHAMTIADAVKWSGLGRTKIYELASEGRLEMVKVGTRSLVLTASLERLLSDAPKLQLKRA